MKKILLFTAIAYLCSCENKKTETASTATPVSTDTTKNIVTNIVEDTTTKQKNNPTTTNITTNQKTVDYYYQKYVNVDSEDPAIGVGPRKIERVDMATGILMYKQEGEKETKKLQLWHKNGFDVLQFAGATLLIEGDKYLDIYNSTTINDFVKKIGNQRSARGGECDYNDSPDLKINEKVEIIMTCSDDAKFREVIGYASMKNGKLVITEK